MLKIRATNETEVFSLDEQDDCPSDDTTHVVSDADVGTGMREDEPAVSHTHVSNATTAPRAAQVLYSLHHISSLLLSLIDPVSVPWAAKSVVRVGANGLLRPGKIGKLLRYKSGKCFLVIRREQDSKINNYWIRSDLSRTQRNAMQCKK